MDYTYGTLNWKKRSKYGQEPGSFKNSRRKAKILNRTHPFWDQKQRFLTVDGKLLRNLLNF